MLLSTPVLPISGNSGTSCLGKPLENCHTLSEPTLLFQLYNTGGGTDEQWTVCLVQLWASGQRGWTTLSSHETLESGDGILGLGRETFAGIFMIKVSAVRGGTLS